MTTQNQRSSRGRRRSPRDRNRSGRPGRSTPPRKPEPQTFWQKVVAFFSGDQQAPRPAGSSNGEPQRSRETRPRERSRKPEAIEVTSPKLYVGNLSFDASESDLYDLFNGVGSVQNAEVVSHRQTQRSKGFAFVTMQSVDEAKRAVDELHDKEFMGRKLVVSGAKTSDSQSYDS